MSERRKQLFACSILAIVPTLLFIDVLLGSNVLYFRDITTYHHPAKSVLRHIVLNGEFPYWNPWFSAGQPLAANPHFGVFYPLTWLILLPGFEAGFQLLAVIHVYIAAFGMYALLRSISLGRPAAVFGGLSFALGGVTISLLNLWPCLFSFAWLPLTALYTRKHLLTRSHGALAAAACFLGLQLIAGEPVTPLLSGLLLGMYAIWQGWTDGGASRAGRMVLQVALISLLALCISAVQTLPAIDLFGDSVRSRGLGWELVRQWSTPPVRIGEFFFPHFLGFGVHDGGKAYWGTHLYEGRSAGFLLSSYGGLAVSVLAAGGLLARIRGAGLFAVSGAVSLLLAAGANTPLLRLLFEAGLATTWRYPEKFLMMIGFTSVVFASMVFDRLLAGDTRLRKTVISIALAVAGVAVAAAVAAHLPVHARLFSTIFATPGEPSARLLSTSARIWRDEVVRTLLFAAILLGLGRVPRRVWLGLMTVFLALDLGPILFEIAPRHERSFFDPPPLASALAPEMDATRLVPYAQWQRHGRRSEPYAALEIHEDAYWVVRNSLTPMVPADLGIRSVMEEDFDLTALLPTADFRRAMVQLVERGSTSWLDTAVAMSNGGYLTVYENFDTAFRKAGGDIRRLQRNRIVRGVPHPRYYFASTLVPIRDQREFVDLLATRRYPRDVAFVGVPVFQTSRGNVHRWSETANTATIDVEARGRAFLVMSVTPHKYWRVAIDGVDTEPIITNIGYQGIIVPAGRHTVTMRYRNPLIAAGAAISLATLLSLALIARRSAPATMRPL